MEALFIAPAVILGARIMGKKKLLKGAGRALKSVASAVSGLPLKGSGKGSGRRRRSRGLNLNKYAKKLIKAKLDAKLMREKLKVVNAIK